MVCLGLGGVAKGWAVDRAVAVIRAAGLANFFVQAGGDLYAAGRHGDRPWRVGIRDPRGSRDQYFAELDVSDAAFSTSGDYERYFELGGRRYCHILDPRSGHPVTHWRSVSVLAPLAIAAGSCTTIAMLKQQDGLAFLKDCGMSYLAIDHAGAFHRSGDADSMSGCPEAVSGYA